MVLERRYLSGADCTWTPLEGSKAVLMRRNGRAFRPSPTNEKRWEPHRIEEPTDPGDLLGTYSTRGAVNKLAYEPEPRW